jgi:hypothetical protein
MIKKTANQAFLKGMRYLFFYSLTILSALFVLSVALTGKEIFLENLLLGYSVIVLTAFVISFITVFRGVKQAIADGEVDDENIFKKNGVLSINFLRKQG